MATDYRAKEFAATVDVSEAWIYFFIVREAENEVGRENSLTILR